MTYNLLEYHCVYTPCGCAEEGAGSRVLTSSKCLQSSGKHFFSFHLAPHHMCIKLNKTLLMIFHLGNTSSVEGKIFGKLCQFCQISERGQYLETGTWQPKSLHLLSSCSAKGPPRQTQACFGFSQTLIFKISLMYSIRIYFVL